MMQTEWGGMPEPASGSYPEREKLVERLRSGRWIGETTGKPVADMLEADAAEIARLNALVAELEEWKQKQELIYWSNKKHINRLLARIIELEDGQ